MRQNAEKPSILIYVEKRFYTADVITELTVGIEEEGIPYSVEVREDTALNNAYHASRDSRLGTGIGVSDEVIIHYEKLKKEAPLFRKDTAEKEISFRNLGCNAARLVKRVPFKSI